MRICHTFDGSLHKQVLPRLVPVSCEGCFQVIAELTCHARTTAIAHKAHMATGFSALSFCDKLLGSLGYLARCGRLLEVRPLFLGVMCADPDDIKAIKVADAGSHLLICGADTTFDVKTASMWPCCWPQMTGVLLSFGTPCSPWQLSHPRSFSSRVCAKQGVTTAPSTTASKAGLILGILVALRGPSLPE